MNQKNSTIRNPSLGKRTLSKPGHIKIFIIQTKQPHLLWIKFCVFIELSFSITFLLLNHTAIFSKHLLRFKRMLPFNHIFEPRRLFLRAFFVLTELFFYTLILLNQALSFYSTIFLCHEAYLSALGLLNGTLSLQSHSIFFITRSLFEAYSSFKACLLFPICLHSPLKPSPSLLYRQ